MSDTARSRHRGASSSGWAGCRPTRGVVFMCHGHARGAPLLRCAPWVSLGAFAALWVARWPLFPLPLDPAYHLLIAQQVVAANGPIAYEWWEAAPFGRPHLYPPLLHLLLAGLLKTGCSALVTIRLASVLLLPLLLLTVWVVARRLVGESRARWTLWSSLLVWSFHLHAATALAATLGLAEFLWWIDALERRHPLTAGLLFAALCYTHLGLPWVALVSVSYYAMRQPVIRLTLLRAAWGLVLALPWWWHLWVHRAFVHVIPRQENRALDLPLLLVLVAGIGLWRCWRLRGRYDWFIALGVGLLVLAPHYTYRWLNGEGMVCWLLLAGVGLQRLSAQLRTVRHHVRVIGLGILSSLLLLGPSLNLEEGRWHWRWMDSAPLHLLQVRGVKERPLAQGVHGPLMERLAARVAAATAPHEILWSNASYAGGWIAALAHRAVSFLMLDEVASARPEHPIDDAHLIIWFQSPASAGNSIDGVLKRQALRPIDEDALAMLWRNPRAQRPAQWPKAVMPFAVAMGLLGVGVGLCWWEATIPRQQARMPV